MKDLISIIVPIYRVEKYLEECIESILNQTYKNLEIILINDGSDDESGSICDNYAEIDNRIIVVHKENGGLDSARKTGILKSKGKYIGYIDGDDWVEPNMYEKLIGYAKRYKVSVVESGIVDFWNEKETRRNCFFEQGSYKGEMFDNYIAPKLLSSDKFFTYGVSPYLCTKLFTRESVLDFQLLPQQKNGFVDDIVVTFPTIAKSRSLYITKEYFYHYRVRENTLKRKIYEDAYEKIQRDFILIKERYKLQNDELYTKYQLNSFFVYMLMLKCPYIFDDINSDEFLLPFGNIHKNSKIILYGAGQCGINLYNYAKNIYNDNLVCWVDKNFEFLGQFYNVEGPNKIQEIDYDYIVIAIMSECALDSVKKDLHRMGVPQEKIRWIKDEYIDNPRKLLKQIDGINELFL